MSRQDLPAEDTHHSQHYDVVVISSGLQGASIACEAASRSLKTLLVSGCTDEFASYPGGIYSGGSNNIESLHFASLMTNFEELAYMHKRAPHIVRPINTCLIDAPHIRSHRFLRVLLTFYQWLQRKKIPSVLIPHPEVAPNSFASEKLTKIVTPEFRINFNRIEIAVMQQLKAFGGDIIQNQQLTHARRLETHWQLDITDISNSQSLSISANTLINCSGCHANDLLKQTLAVKTRSTVNHQLVSAHLFIQHAQTWTAAVALQQANKSFVYSYPIDEQHLCIGPIIAEQDTEQSKHKALDEFLTLWNNSSTQTLSHADIVHCQWSSQPVLDDPSCHSSQARPECYLDLNNPGGRAPLLNVFGNNMIQHRRLAQQGLDIVMPFTNAPRNPKFLEMPLPGGDFEQQTPDQLLQQFYQRYNNLPKPLITRLFYTYGTNLLKILSNSKHPEELGKDFSHNLFEVEVRYLIDHEWATNENDILWRHTNLGLVFNADQREVLHEFLST